MENDQKLVNEAYRYRLSVFRSNRHVYAQIIDDRVGETRVAASSLGLKVAGNSLGSKQVGEVVGKQALGLGLKYVRFDRGGRKYGKSLKALADAARGAGLAF